MLFRRFYLFIILFFSSCLSLLQGAEKSPGKRMASEQESPFIIKKRTPELSKFSITLKQNSPDYEYHNKILQSFFPGVISEIDELSLDDDIIITCDYSFNFPTHLFGQNSEKIIHTLFLEIISAATKISKEYGFGLNRFSANLLSPRIRRIIQSTSPNNFLYSILAFMEFAYYNKSQLLLIAAILCLTDTEKTSLAQSITNLLSKDYDYVKEHLLKLILEEQAIHESNLESLNPEQLAAMQRCFFDKDFLTKHAFIGQNSKSVFRFLQHLSDSCISTDDIKNAIKQFQYFSHFPEQKFSLISDANFIPLVNKAIPVSHPLFCWQRNVIIEMEQLTNSQDHNFKILLKSIPLIQGNLITIKGALKDSEEFKENFKSLVAALKQVHRSTFINLKIQDLNNDSFDNFLSADQIIEFFDLFAEIPLDMSLELDSCNFAIFNKKQSPRPRRIHENQIYEPLVEPDASVSSLEDDLERNSELDYQTGELDENSALENKQVPTPDISRLFFAFTKPPISLKTNRVTALRKFQVHGPANHLRAQLQSLTFTDQPTYAEDLEEFINPSTFFGLDNPSIISLFTTIALIPSLESLHFNAIVWHNISVKTLQSLGEIISSINKLQTLSFTNTTCYLFANYRDEAKLKIKEFLASLAESSISEFGIKYNELSTKNDDLFVRICLKELSHIPTLQTLNLHNIEIMDYTRLEIQAICRCLQKLKSLDKIILPNDFIINPEDYDEDAFDEIITEMTGDLTTLMETIGNLSNLQKIFLNKKILPEHQRLIHRLVGQEKVFLL